MKTIILISGKMRSGKNQFAEYLKSYLESKCESVRTDLFALSLKQSCHADFTFMTKEVNEQIIKIKNLIDTSYVSNTQNFVEAKHLLDDLMVTKDDNWYEEKTMMSRLLLQTYGTQIFRNRIDYNYWVNQVIDRFLVSKEKYTLITDTRFDNEIVHVKDVVVDRVVSIRINRELKLSGVSNHISENGLDDYKNWDYVIDNNSTLENLKSHADSISNILIGEK